MQVNTSSPSDLNNCAPLIDAAGTLCYVAGVVSFIALAVILGTVLVPLAVGGALVITGFLLSRWADSIRIKKETCYDPSLSPPAVNNYVAAAASSQSSSIVPEVLRPYASATDLSREDAIRTVDERTDINQESKELIKEYLTGEKYVSITIERYIGFARQHTANPKSDNCISAIIAYRAAQKEFNDYIANIGPRLIANGLKEEVVQDLLREKGIIGMAIKTSSTGLPFRNDLSTDGIIAQSDFSRFQSGITAIEELVDWAVQNKQSD